jgi:hypothetical protein
MAAGQAGETPAGDTAPGTATIACPRYAFEPPQSWGQPNFFGERKNASRLEADVEAARSLSLESETQFCHFLTLLRPLGT